jgi:hypothetical protein
MLVAENILDRGVKCNTERGSNARVKARAIVRLCGGVPNREGSIKGVNNHHGDAPARVIIEKRNNR